MAATGLELTELFDRHGSAVRWRRIGSGPPVVLCHGTPWSSHVWRALVDRLRHEYSIYVWDMPGYGCSDKHPDADVSLREQGAVLAALVDHWGLERPDVVAHDVGGAVALRAHLLHGVPVRSLVLIDVVALRPWGSPFFRLVGSHAEVFAALPPKLHEALVREYIRGASSRGLSDHVLEDLVAPWLGDGQAAFYRQIEQADERYTAELEDRFAHIDAPTLVVWGTADQWIPVDRAARLAAVIPNSSLVLIEGAGHLIQEDDPAALEAAIVRWLAERP